MAAGQRSAVGVLNGLIDPLAIRSWWLQKTSQVYNAWEDDPSQRW